MVVSHLYTSQRNHLHMIVSERAAPNTALVVASCSATPPPCTRRDSGATLVPLNGGKSAYGGDGTFSWERALCRPVLQDLLLLGLVLDTVGLVDLVWWTRVSSSNGSGGLIFWDCSVLHPFLGVLY